MNQAGRNVRRKTAIVALLSLALNLPLGGCKSRPQPFYDVSFPYPEATTAVEEPEVEVTGHETVRSLPAPHSVRNGEPQQYWELSLQEAIQIALSDSEVTRDLGTRVLSGPTGAVATVYDPALSESDLRSGPEAALSEFDAQFTTSLFFEHNEHALNNFLFGGGAFELVEDKAYFQAEINKKTVLGTEFALRNETNYSRNDALFNLFRSSYDTKFEFEARQPLLQGAGVEFNRIAGPNARAGIYNGVLIGRINTDITLADFETGVRDLLSDVERTYWDLYYAYRNLDALKFGRDSALETWRAVQRKLEAGTADEEQEANARAQYYFYKSQVIEALSGTLLPGPIAGPPMGGVYLTERRLRSLLGLPANDGRLIRPKDEPLTAETVFDWEGSLQDALWRRVELRRQKWVIKRMELELIAARNFTKMRLDLVGRYRKPGFGDNLIGQYDYEFSSAFDNLFNGDRNEWTLGMQLMTPIGNRIGHTAVRNAELNLSRERAIHREQELQISHDLSNSFGELDRAYAITLSNFNRKVATHQQLEESLKKYDAGLIPLEFVLQAHLQTTQADTAYYRSLVDYNIAISRINFSRGTLLDYYQVYLAEGPWSEEAHHSAAKQSRRFKPANIDYRLTLPPAVSQGVYPQRGEGSEIPVREEPIEAPFVEPRLAPQPEPLPEPDEPVIPPKLDPFRDDPP